MIHDKDILAAAVIGYEIKTREIEAKLTEIRKMIKPGAWAISRAATPRSKAYDIVLLDGYPPPRKISAAGRARIAAAQKKRWAAHAAAAAAVAAMKKAKAGA